MNDTTPLHELAAGHPADPPPPAADPAAPDAARGASAPESDPAETTAAAAAGTPPADDEAPDDESPDDELPDDETPDADDREEPAENGFVALGLSEPVLRAVAEMGYLEPTPIQAQAIPVVLMGRDVMGVAQTGTGKTAGFTLPMLDILSGSRARARMPRSLILEPTRELALQVAENFVKYGKYLRLTHALIIGGESMSDQRDVLTRGVDVLIATPGRLLDMFERGAILLSDAKLLVIDEADRMLDMGFIPDVERIVGLLPRTRQTLFFSATMAPEIKRLADAFLQNPKEISVSRQASVATTIIQKFTLVAEHDKREALRRLVRSEDVQNALIFCNRKRDVDVLYKSLTRHNFSVGALHGDMAQPVRFATLERFKAGEIRLLCCSDVAARGLDIGGLSHVFNFDVPIHAEDYVHRIGRTGRAGREGRSFTLATPEDRFAVEAIEKLIGNPIVRMQIEGLDPVEWSEDGGRRGRGRGRGKAAPAKPRAEAAKPKAEAKPRPEPKARPEPKPRPEKPRAEAPPPRAEATGAEPQHGEAQHREPQHREPQHREPQHREPQHREPLPREASRREPRRRDDDLGPAVRGFGDDVPAFMLIPTRRHRGTQASEATEAEA